MKDIFQIQQLIDAFSTTISSDDREFRDLLVKSMDLLNLNDEDCANLFDASRSTITRWRNGTTSPTRVVRHLVFDVLKRQCKKYVRTYQRNSERTCSEISPLSPLNKNSQKSKVRKFTVSV